MTYRSYHDATTRSSVLRAVSDTGDAAAWARFFDLYAGFVFAIARSKGLSAEDADDVVQGVFVELARKMPTFEYDRARGRFRSYLLELVNWRVIDKFKAGKRETELLAAYGDATKASYDDETKGKSVSSAEKELADREWQTAALDEALRRLEPEVRPEHFAAFVESAIEGIDSETVMRLHGMTRDNLYQIRARLTAKLKPLVAAVLKEMDEGRPPRTSALFP